MVPCLVPLRADGGVNHAGVIAMASYPTHHKLVRHEPGATHAADGYARASGKVGVAIATSGPGATNMVTGIATAMMDPSPILCITGQVPSTVLGTDAFQEIDITGKALGATRAGLIETTFPEETETDLFCEQAVLGGGVSALVKAGFGTLLEARYQPEIAYFECLHELKLIVDLIDRGGLSYMRHSVSDPAEFGDYAAGPHIVSEYTREAMRHLLREIQNGNFATPWIEESRSGRKRFLEQTAEERAHPLGKVGIRLPALMPFLQPVPTSFRDAADASRDSLRDSDADSSPDLSEDSWVDMSEAVSLAPDKGAR